MPEPDVDVRVLRWVRDGGDGPSDWVLPSVLAHVRRHPRHQTWTGRLGLLRWRRQERARLRLVAALALVATLVVVAAGLLALGAGMPTRPAPSPSLPPTGPASVVPVVVRATDPLGDAPADRDIVAVTAAVDASSVTLVVDLRMDWERAPGNGVFIAFVEWLADERSSAGSFGHGDCEAWLVTYRVLIAEDRTLSGSLAGTRATFAGPRMTLIVPRSSLGNPSSLGVAVVMAAPDGDVFPAGRTGTCFDILGGDGTPLPG